MVKYTHKTFPLFRFCLHDLLCYRVHLPGVHNNIASLSEVQLELYSHKISFAPNIYHGQWIFLIFCSEHNSLAAMLCAKFQKDSLIVREAVDKWDFVRFQFQTDFGRIFHIVTWPKSLIPQCLTSALLRTMKPLISSSCGKTHCAMGPIWQIFMSIPFKSLEKVVL